MIDSSLSLFAGPLLLTLIATLVGAGLAYVGKRFAANENPVVEDINRLLPQTQCAQCGHPGCRPYAEAIAAGEAINRCPPGGEATIVKLANLLGREVLPQDTEYGLQAPESLVKIREAECIGCTLCIQACPVDAIIGAPQQMHVVLEELCTGCNLCLEPCPVDCIDELLRPPTEQTPTRTLRPIGQLQVLPSECIRCGDCEPVCPKNLKPHALYWQRQDMDAMAQLNLTDCIECRLCDRVCPSHLPLTQFFVDAKSDLKAQMRLAEVAEVSKLRFEHHEYRQQQKQSAVKTRPDKSDKHALFARLKS